MATRLRAEPSPLDALVAALDSDAVFVDPATLELFGQDVFARGHPPLAVVRPTSTAAIRACAAHGLAVVPRSVGLSYTCGYLPDAPGAVAVDMRAMDRVLAIDLVDMVARVQAGCTWATLHAACAPLGVRPPMWGTLSGRFATIGGGMRSTRSKRLSTRTAA